MISLKEKLRQFDTPRLVTRQSQRPPLAEQLSTIGAEWVENVYGCYILREKLYPASFVYGSRHLGDFFRLTPQSFMQAGGDARYGATYPENVILFDAETTGLAGGSGTCAFLFGIGFIRSKHFIVRQYFMPDFNSEKAMLYDLIREFTNKSCLVSYNGKRFDLPLLQSRLVMNRFSPFSASPLHIDLLYPVRRLWKQQLPSCSLQQVEKSILGIERLGDIPGCEIPGIYFQFLTGGEFDRIPAIFKHNVQDILSMAAILVEIHRVFVGEQSAVVPDSYWLFRILCDIGREEDALTNIESRAAHPSENAVRFQLQRADVLKKMERYEEAAAIWTSLLALPQVVEAAFEELAKLYEHVFKNYHQALAIVERFEKRLQVRHALRDEVHGPALSASWRKRRKRLASRLNEPQFSSTNYCLNPKVKEIV